MTEAQDFQRKSAQRKAEQTVEEPLEQRLIAPEIAVPAQVSAKTFAGFPIFSLGDLYHLPLERVFTGGESSVFKTHPLDEPLETVIVKQFHGGVKDDLPAIDDEGKERGGAYTSEMQRFQREIHALQQLGERGITAKLRRAYFQNNHVTGELVPTIEMNVVKGPTLGELKRGGYTFAEREVLWLLQGVGKRLQEVHEEGLIHRDLSLENIKVLNGVVTGHAENYKLLDFALSITQTHRTIAGGQTAARGTLLFVDPKQWDGEEPTQTSDIYSLGAMAKYLLGKQQVSAPVQKILERMTAMEGRYSSVEEMVAEVESLHPKTQIFDLKEIFGVEYTDVLGRKLGEGLKDFIEYCKAQGLQVKVEEGRVDIFSKNGKYIKSIRDEADIVREIFTRLGEQEAENKKENQRLIRRAKNGGLVVVAESEERADEVFGKLGLEQETAEQREQRSLESRMQMLAKYKVGLGEKLKKAKGDLNYEDGLIFSLADNFGFPFFTSGEKQVTQKFESLLQQQGYQKHLLTTGLLRKQVTPYWTSETVEGKVQVLIETDGTAVWGRNNAFTGYAYRNVEKDEDVERLVKETVNNDFEEYKLALGASAVYGAVASVLAFIYPSASIIALSGLLLNVWCLATVGKADQEMKVHSLITGTDQNGNYKAITAALRRK